MAISNNLARSSLTKRLSAQVTQLPGGGFSRVGYSGQISGISALASKPTLRLSGIPTFMKSVKR